MWTMTEIGFFSAVQHRDNPDLLLIRARSKKDLDNLLDFAIESEVPDMSDVGDIERTLQGADYPYRLTCTKEAWAVIMAALIGVIDYDNFKNRIAVSNPTRAHTYGRVWSTMIAVEREPDAGVYKDQPKLVQRPKKAAAKKSSKKVSR